jgi:nitroreductase
MAGIVFLKTCELDKTRRFYAEEVGMTLWLEQPGIAILKHGNMLIGLHEQPEPDLDGMLTFFYDTRQEVDDAFARLKDIATTEPKENPKYHIYHFFGKDPEGRNVEFQHFLHPVEPFRDGATALASRRSIRRFRADDVPEKVLDGVFESCRYAPSARHSQPCYLTVVRDRARIDALAAVRGGSSAPIGRAPLAVAVVADPEQSGRHVEDGCIMAYHLLLAAWMRGLGTCWIGGMDRQETKTILSIPDEHYVAAVTPVGYPAESPDPKQRKALNEFVRFVE